MKIKQSANIKYIEMAKFTILQMYSILIFSLSIGKYYPESIMFIKSHSACDDGCFLKVLF